MVEQPEPVFPRLVHSITRCPNVQPDKAWNVAAGLASAMHFPYNNPVSSSLIFTNYTVLLFSGNILRKEYYGEVREV